MARLFAGLLAHLGGPQGTILYRDPVDLPILGPVLRRTVAFVQKFSRSDHMSFWEKGIPAIWINDTANFRNPNYHLPTDTLDHPGL